MIAVLGIMVGFYILTRMTEILEARQMKPKIGFVGVMAWLTIIVAIIAMTYFLLGPDLFRKLAG